MKIHYAHNCLTYQKAVNSYSCLRIAPVLLNCINVYMVGLRAHWDVLNLIVIPLPLNLVFLSSQSVEKIFNIRCELFRILKHTEHNTPMGQFTSLQKSQK